MNFQEAAEYFARKAQAIQRAHSDIAMAGAKVIEHEAKSYLGHYQAAAGPYGPWPELSQHTKEARARMGFPPDEPLLLTGKLRDSITSVATPGGAAVGTNEPYAPYLEHGTSKMPARPFIGRAAYVAQDRVAEAQAAEVKRILTNS